MESDKVIGFLVSIIFIIVLAAILSYCFSCIRDSSKVYPDQSNKAEKKPVISIL